MENIQANSYYQLKILLLFVATKSALFCCIRQLMYSMERQVYQVFLYSIVNLFATIFFMENITFHANDLQQEGTVQGCLEGQNCQMAAVASVLDK